MLSAQTVRELLHYDPETGIFRWRQAAGRWGRIPAGSIAGTLSCSHGYWAIGIDGRAYLAHRLAWLYMDGEWPKAELDHINLDRTDTRWCNLRAATKSQNGANRRASTKNRSRHKGVSWDACREQWFACIRVNRKTIALGRHDTLDAACVAYRLAATRYFGEYARVE